VILASSFIRIRQGVLDKQDAGTYYDGLREQIGSLPGDVVAPEKTAAICSVNGRTNNDKDLGNRRKTRKYLSTKATSRLLPQYRFTLPDKPPGRVALVITPWSDDGIGTVDQ